jgi:DNA-binding MarR family transcriptional regulator
MRAQEESAPTSATLGPVLDFMRLVWAVDHGLAARSKQMEQTLGVTGPQRFVVRVVGRFPGISAGELAEILHLHPSTLTGILRRLEAAGVLKRKDDPVDRRRALFHLSPKGKRVDGARRGTVEDAVQRTLAGLRENEIGAARRVLTALARELVDEDEGR